jgi:hypothetical protein
MFGISLHHIVLHMIYTCVTIATRIRTGRPGFDSRKELRIFLFASAFRPVLGPTQPQIQWVPGGLSLGLRRPGREADRSPPSSARD